MLPTTIGQFSTEVLENELAKRKELSGLEKMIRDLISKGYNRHDFVALIERITKESEPKQNIRNV